MHIHKHKQIKLNTNSSIKTISENTKTRKPHLISPPPGSDNSPKSEPDTPFSTPELFLLLNLKLDHNRLATEKADKAVHASQSRRAPKPGGNVQTKRSLGRRPKKTKPVHLGRHDQPIKSPITTASQIGTEHNIMSTNVSIIAGFFTNSSTSKKKSSIIKLIYIYMYTYRDLYV